MNLKVTLEIRQLLPPFVYLFFLLPIYSIEIYFILLLFLLLLFIIFRQQFW